MARRRALKHFLLEPLYRAAARVPKKGVRVLLYHAVNDSGARVAVPPRLFAAHLAALKESFQFVDAHTVARYLRGEAKIPPRALLLTFDDGYRDNLTHALPLLERYHIPAIIFLATGLLGKSLPTREGGSLPLLSAQEVRSLAHHPLLAFGSHFHTHERLSRLPEEVVRKQARVSRAIVEDLTGTTPSFAAYPFGDWNRSVWNAARECYDAVFGISPGSLTPESDPASLPRNAVDAETSVAMLRGIAAIGRILHL